MKNNINVVGVGIDHTNKEIVFMTNFDYKKAQDYIRVSKVLITKIDHIMQYTVTFKNKKFKNIFELGRACSITLDKEIDALINPKLNTNTLKSLGIISVDFKDRFVEIDTKVSNISAIGLIRSIPTLLPLKIKHGDRVYNSIASMAKEVFKDCSSNDVIHLTNEFAKDFLEFIKDQGVDND